MESSPIPKINPKRMEEKRREVLREATVLITSHLNADFDSFGSMLGGLKLWNKKGKNCVLLWPGAADTMVQSFIEEKASEQIPELIFSLKEIPSLSQIIELVIVDARKRSRIKQVHQLLERKDILISVYDHHHPSEDDLYCDASRLFISKSGACTSDLVYHIMKYNEQTPQNLVFNFVI